MVEPIQNQTWYGLALSCAVGILGVWVLARICEFAMLKNDCDLPFLGPLRKEKREREAVEMAVKVAKAAKIVGLEGREAALAEAERLFAAEKQALDVEKTRVGLKADEVARQEDVIQVAEAALRSIRMGQPTAQMRGGRGSSSDEEEEDEDEFWWRYT